MELLTKRGNINCSDFGEITVIDCKALKSEECGDCPMYKIFKEVNE